MPTQGAATLMTSASDTTVAVPATAIVEAVALLLATADVYCCSPNLSSLDRGFDEEFERRAAALLIAAGAPGTPDGVEETGYSTNPLVVEAHARAAELAGEWLAQLASEQSNYERRATTIRAAGNAFPDLPLEQAAPAR